MKAARIVTGNLTRMDKKGMYQVRYSVIILSCIVFIPLFFNGTANAQDILRFLLGDTGTFNGTEGFGLAGGKTGTVLKVKGLIEGSNVTITASGDSAFTITAAGGSGAWTTAGDTAHLIDADNDTLARFWDNDGGEVTWDIGADQSTLHIVGKADTGDYLGADTIRVFVTNRVDTLTANMILDGGNIVMVGAETIDGIDVSKLDSTLEGYPIDTATGGGSNNLDDGDILEWNAANSEWRPTVQTGGSGTVDSAGIYDGNSDHWSTAKAWLLTFGYGLTWTDSLKDSIGAVDTGTIIVDTADAVADAEPLPVTGNAVYDWVTAQSYLTSITLDNVGNPDVSKTFTMANKNLSFLYSAPMDSGFVITATGGFSGRLVNIHQHGPGNPGADVTLLDVHAEDVDLLVLNVENTTPGDTLASFVGGAVYVDSLEVNGVTRTREIESDSGFFGTIDLTTGDTGILNAGTANPGRFSSGDVDAHFGNDSFGYITIGEAWFGMNYDTTYAGPFDLDQTIVIGNMGSPPNFEIVAISAAGGIRWAVPPEGAGKAMNFIRSAMCAGPVGPAQWNNNIVLGATWGFDSLDMATDVDGADFGVQNDLMVRGEIFTDSIRSAGQTELNIDQDLKVNGDIDATGTIYSGDVRMDTSSVPTYVTLEDWWDVSQSAMTISGGAITQDATDSTVIDIAAGAGQAKKTDSDIAENVFFDFSAGNDIAVANNTQLIVYVDYNGGSPILATTAAASVNFTTQVALGRVHRLGNHMHITQGGQNFTNFNVKNSFRIYELYDLHRGSGLITVEGADASNDIDISAGAFYLGNNRQTVSAAASFTDGIELWYGDGAGGFTQYDTTALNDVSYDDGDGTRAALTTNRYNIFWVFMETDGELVAIYDSVTQSGGYSLGAAQAKTVVTTLPSVEASAGVFVGKIIVQESAGITSIEYPWATTFAGAATADHGNLAGLGDDDHTQYLKESDTAAYALTILASPTLTGTVTIPTPFTLGAVSVTPTGTELNYVDGVTSAIQTQLDAKESVTNVAKIGDDTTNFKRAVDSVDGYDDGGIDSTHLAEGACDSSEIKDSAVTVGKIDHSDAEDNWLDGEYYTLADFDNSTIDTSAGGALQVKDGGITDVKIDSLDPSKLEQAGATDGQVLEWNNTSGKWEPATDDVGDTLRETNVFGGLNLYGPFSQTDIKYELDIRNMSSGGNADTTLDIATLAWVDQDGLGDTIYWEDYPDSNFQTCALHPSIFYSAAKWNGYSHHLFHSPIVTMNENDSTRFELPTYTVSNNGTRYHPFIDSFSVSPTYDSLSQPIIDADEYLVGGTTSTALADPDILMNVNADLWCAYKILGMGRHQLIAGSYSSDGLNWAFKSASNDTFYLIDTVMDINAKVLLSPCWELGVGGKYKLWVVFSHSATTDTSSIWLYEADSVTGPYTRQVEIAIEHPAAKKLWHMDIKARGPDEYVMIGTYTDSVPSDPSSGAGGQIHIGVSRDGGRSFTVDTIPVLIASTESGAWDEKYLYRATGFWLDEGRYTAMRLIYSAKADEDEQWGTGQTIIYFDDSVLTVSDINMELKIIYPSGPVGGAGSAGPGDSVRLELSSHDGKAHVLYKDSSIAGGAGPWTDSAYTPFQIPSWASKLDSVIIIMKGKHATADSAEVSKLEVFGPSQTGPAVYEDSSYYASTTARNTTSIARYSYPVDNSQFQPGDVFNVMIEKTLGANVNGVVYIYRVFCKVSQ